MEQQINLHQPILGAERRLFSARAIATAVLLFALSLGAISAFAAWRLRGAERAIAALEGAAAARGAAAQRGLDALHAAGSLEQVEARARQLALDIAEREQVLAAVRRGAADPSAGFSARLEALGRQLPQGLWLQRIVLSSGDRPLALAGATNDARLVPRYLGALAGERSLSAARFDRFELRRPKAGDVAAAALFQVGDTPAVPTGDEP